MKKKIVENYSARYIAMENTLILAQIVTGFILLRPFGAWGVPILSILYALFAFLMLGVILRRDLCTHCYYYGKNCHCGWGKLSSALFKKGVGNQKRGVLLAGFTWGLLMLIPLAGALILFLTQFSMARFIPLGIFLVFVLINLAIHKKDCSECAMRETCPASAAKAGGGS